MAENMDNRELAIKLTGVKKRYKLGAVGGATLQEDLQSWWAKVRGKPDPNLPIGQDARLVGKSFMALNGIDLEVHKGEAIGIIGGNGAGKSTMLKILSRVTAPTEGKVQIWGRIASMLEVGTGFHGELTGRENIYMNGAILGMTREEIDKKIEDIIDFSEVRDFIDTPVKRYSSGMYVKLAFSVAAHLDSEIMIMDEVLAVGDVNFQQKCLKKMRDVAKVGGRTVLYVSHNMSTIRQLCDRCIVLEQGRVVFIGDVESAIEVYTQHKEIEQKAEYDVSQIKRIDGITGNVYMNKVMLDSSEINQGEKLYFMVEMQSKATVENAIMRFVVFSRSGETIGMSYSMPFDLLHGSEKVRFTFDASLLSPGKYMADIILCSYDGKTQIRHDIVIKAFAFNVVEKTIRYNMEWNKNGWGNIAFRDMEVQMTNG